MGLVEFFLNYLVVGLIGGFVMVWWGNSCGYLNEGNFMLVVMILIIIVFVLFVLYLFCCVF